MAPVYRLTGAKIEIKFNKTIGKLNFTSGLKVLSLRHLLKLKATNVMKIALAQLNYTIGDFDSNRKKNRRVYRFGEIPIRATDRFCGTGHQRRTRI